MQALFSNFFKFFSKSFQIPEKPCNLKVFKDPSPLLFHLFSKESCCTGCQLKLCLSHFLLFIPGKEDHRSHRISFTDDGTDCFRSNPFRSILQNRNKSLFPCRCLIKEIEAFPSAVRLVVKVLSPFTAERLGEGFITFTADRKSTRLNSSHL